LTRLSRIVSQGAQKPLRRSIFYLDDEASHLEVFREIFGAEFDVRVSTTPHEARRLLAECAADIIISDQKMPQVEGIEFLREARQLCPASFRILLTGEIHLLEVMNEIREGVFHVFLTKPWTEVRMREMLERARAFLDRKNK
jgi:DNA-binding NtrC family response regulator